MLEATSEYRRQLAGLWAKSGVTIESPHASVLVNNEACRLICEDEALQIPETYMKGMLREGSITFDELIARLTKNGIPRRWIRSPSMRRLLRTLRDTDQQGVELAKRVAGMHYDELAAAYPLMFDGEPYWQYSCARWADDAKNLGEAQLYRMDLICRKLQLERGMSVLDVGCGTGGLLQFMAEYYGVRGTGITNSPEHARFAQERLKKHNGEIVLGDWRRFLSKTFDRVVSVGSFEHVGLRHYREFVEFYNRHLAIGGLALIHTIGGGGALPFLDAYEFPGGQLPSEAQLREALDGIFVTLDWHEFGRDYDPTLMSWANNLRRHRGEMLAAGFSEEKYNEKICYLLYCAGLSRSGCTKLWQIVVARSFMPYMPVR